MMNQKITTVHNTAKIDAGIMMFTNCCVVAADDEPLPPAWVE